MSAAQNPVILTYHSVYPGSSPLRTPPSLFAEQMEWLSLNARVVALEEIGEAIARRKPLPQRAVVLTFDDGFEDFYTNAAPVLKRFGFPATVFLCTGYCGRTNCWPSQPKWVDEQPLLNWTQATELAGHGFALGAHSITHPDITELPLPEAEQEVAGSRREIERLTGRSPGFFCYPYGRWNARVRDIVSKHFRGACSTAAGVLEPAADVFALPRVDVHYIRHLTWFRALFTNRFHSYISLRRRIRRLQRQPEGFYPRA